MLGINNGSGGFNFFFLNNLAVRFSFKRRI